MTAAQLLSWPGNKGTPWYQGEFLLPLDVTKCFIFVVQNCSDGPDENTFEGFSKKTKCVSNDRSRHDDSNEYRIIKNGATVLYPRGVNVRSKFDDTSKFFLLPPDVPELAWPLFAGRDNIAALGPEEEYPEKTWEQTGDYEQHPIPSESAWAFQPSGGHRVELLRASQTSRNMLGATCLELRWQRFQEHLSNSHVPFLRKNLHRIADVK